MASVKISALLLHAVELAAELGRLFFGTQVHAAQPLAFRFEFDDVLLDVVGRGQIGGLFHADALQQFGGLALEIVADHGCVFRAALAGRFQPRLDSRPRLTRRREAGLGIAQSLVGLAKRVCRLGKLVGRGFARRFGLSDLVQDLGAPLCNFSRQVRQRLKLGLDAAEPLVEARHLRARALRALEPANTLFVDRFQPELPAANIALDAVQRRLRLGVSVPLEARLLFQLLKLCFGMIDRPRGGERVLSVLASRLCLFACISRPLAPLFQALQLVRLLHRGALGLREGGALLCQGSLRGARRIAKALFGRLRFGGGRLCRLPLGIGAVGRFPDIIKLSFEAGQAVALREPARSGAWSVRSGHEPIPAPEIALLGNKPLAGAQAIFKTVAILPGGDDADLHEPAR